MREGFDAIDSGLLRTGPGTELPCPPDVLRWDPFPINESTGDFLDGLATIAVNGDARGHTGLGIHIYRADRGMGKKFFYNADGELLIVPQQGAVLAQTELGQLYVAPGEILVIPRGLKFRIELPDGPARGYVCENYGSPLELPERGPVGSNGFANNRDFQYPVAWFEDREEAHSLVVKFCGQLYQTTLDRSPLDVVAWVGNSAPYKYDLSRFNVINTVSFDHPDPSIFTVLTSPSDTDGVANVDFVVFPPRWMVAEDTFRPPWFHRNIMSEFMGLIKGAYDAKGKGFEPGGMSLHNCMTPHGPEAAAFEKASAAELKPERYENTLAFMFESRYIISPTKFAMESEHRQRNYSQCWSGLKKHFDGNP
jgi:homogentisate 1,2-dioxygenase